MLRIQHLCFTSLLLPYFYYYCFISFSCSLLKTRSLSLRNASVPAIWALTEIRGPKPTLLCLSSTEASRVSPHFSLVWWRGKRDPLSSVWCIRNPGAATTSFMCWDNHDFIRKIFQRKGHPPAYLPTSALASPRSTIQCWTGGEKKQGENRLCSHGVLSIRFTASYQLLSQWPVFGAPWG